MKESLDDCRVKIKNTYPNNDFNSVKLIKTLIFSCFQNEFCKNRKIFSNSICTLNCLKQLAENNYIDEIHFENEKYKIIFDRESTTILKDFSKFLNKLEKFELDFKNYNKSCMNKKTCQKNHTIFLKRIFGDASYEGILFFNPIKAYLEISNEIQLTNLLIKKNHACKKCSNAYLNYLQKTINLYNKQKIIKNFLLLAPPDKKSNFEEIYSKIFQYKIINKKEILEITFEKHYEDSQIIDQYFVDPYFIQIYKNQTNVEPLYVYSKPKKILDIPNSSINENALLDERLNFFKLNELLKYNLERYKKYFEENKINLNEYSKNTIKLLCFENLGLKKIIPFLLDKKIEEIFLDGIKSNIYIDHSKFGRCSTNVRLNSNDIENFKTRIRIENNLLLDEEHPQLKTDLYTDYFNVRVSCNIQPLAVDLINFSIRKLRKKMFSIIELINLRTISIPVAAYLCFLLFHKRNIIVIGSPGAGKTTLINSLDILTPTDWRKIYLEDVIESIDQFSFGKHQVRFNITSKLQKNNLMSKSIQVRETLHRTPDMVFIGELIHKETVDAFFFLLKTGLRCGLGTCHGESPELIIQRWIEDDKIPQNSIKNVDAIVQIAKTKFGRRIIRISEIGDSNKENKNYEIKNIFLRDPATDLIKLNFNSLEELYTESPVMCKIKSLLIEFISKDKFINELKIYEKFFELLRNYEIIKLDDIIYYFNKFWVLKSNFEQEHQLQNNKLEDRLEILFS
ncbi:MAG: ATPase, T2SS/T4P/T4SS family [Candidatus Helarchaeota archaeon]